MSQLNLFPIEVIDPAEVEAGRYWLSLDATLEEGRSALRGCIAYDVWAEQMERKRRA